MKTKDLFAELRDLGWYLARISGSHHIFVHPKAMRPIPVAVHDKEIPNIIAKAILRQARRSRGEKR